MVTRRRRPFSSSRRPRVRPTATSRPSSARAALAPIATISRGCTNSISRSSQGEQAPISRAEISRTVGISKPTVSLALQSLLTAGLVQEAQPDPGRPNYGATFFEPVPDAALVLGLDFGARFLDRFR